MSNPSDPRPHEGPTRLPSPQPATAAPSPDTPQPAPPQQTDEIFHADNLSIGMAAPFTTKAVAKEALPAWSDRVIAEGQYAPGALAGSYPPDNLRASAAPAESIAPLVVLPPPPKPVVNEPAVEPCNITWHQAHGKPQTTAPLDHLPDGVAFPDDFPEPIRYDAALKVLLYRGFMDTNSYRFLQKQSHDLDYIRAIDELNIHSGIAAAEPAAPAQRSYLGWLLGAGAAVAAVLAWAVLHHHHP